MASPNKQKKLSAGSRRGISAGTTEMLQAVSASSFTKNVMATIQGQEGSPWDKIFNGLSTNSRQHTKEMNVEMGKFIQEHGGIEKMTFDTEKIPMAMQYEVQLWAERMSTNYEKNAAIAADLKDDTGSAAYKEAVKKMSKINQAFMDLDSDLLGFQKFRTDNVDGWDNVGGQVTAKNAAIYMAFMNPNSLGKDGVFDDIFSISRDGRMSYSLAYDELSEDGKKKTGKTLYHEPALLSDLKIPAKDNQTTSGSGFHNHANEVVSTNTDFSEAQHIEMDNDGFSYNDGKWRAMETTPEELLTNYLSQTTGTEEMDILFNASYSSVLYDANGVRETNQSSTNVVTTWSKVNSSGKLIGSQFSDKSDCGAGCVPITTRTEGDKIAHWGGDEELVVDKYLNDLEAKAGNFNAAFQMLYHAINSPDGSGVILPKLSNSDKREYIRNQMKEGHFIKSDGTYTSKVGESGAINFYKEDYSKYLWYKRMSNEKNITTKSTGKGGPTPIIGSILEFLDGSG